MKLTFLFFMMGLMQISASVYSQTAKLTLDMRNARVIDVLEQIEKQSEFRFAYSAVLIDLERRVSVNVDDKNIDETLDALFVGSGVKHITRDRHIMLYPQELDSQNSTDLQQQNSLSGIVTDNSGQTLPGVTVMVKGTTQGTVTNNYGNYSLTNIPEDATLVFSFVGMQTKEVVVGNQTSINVTMEEEVIGIEEVVAIGYGSLQKREVTSSITSIGEKDLIPGVSGNPMAAMQDKVTGLSIETSNGTSPNATTSVQLRGVASILAGQGPLIVIDGVPGGSLNSVSREDIQSIDILKDASAGAIYGTRAAGGVILITTKQAKEGKIRLNYTSEFITETIRKIPYVLSAQEFVSYGLGEDYGHDTDWFEEVTVNYPFRQRHHLSLSGGSATSKIYATFVTSKQEGIAIGDKQNEVGGRINGNFTLLDGFAEIIVHTDYRKVNSERSSNEIFNQALKLNPTLSPYDKSQVHGLNVWTGGWEYFNPVADILLRDDRGANQYFLADVTLKMNITRNLSTQAMVATNNRQWRDIYYQSAQHKTSLDNNRDGYASQTYGQNNDKTFEWIASYVNDFDGHVVRGVAGYSFQEFNGDGFNMNNADFPVDGINAWDMSKGTFLSIGKAGMGSWKDPRTRLVAFFGRTNYSYRDKYMVTISGRYEGSSKFYVDNRWGIFPSVSGGWRISGEPFMDNFNFIDDLKLRAGYGVTGNESFNPGVATRMYKSDTWWLVDGEWLYTYGLAHNQNKDLQWEEKKEFNIGVDFSLFNNKLIGKFDIYNRKVDKMIYDISVSVPPAIHDKTTMNVGTLKNYGWEAELSYNVLRSSDWDYNTTLQISNNKSVLESLWGSQTYWDRAWFPSPGNPGYGVRLYPGEEIGKFHVWRFAGFTEEGNWMLYDKDGIAFDVTKRTKTDEDKAFVGNAIPKLRMSWDHKLRYKDWELNAFFTSWLGHDVFNTIDMYYGIANVEGQNVMKHAYETKLQNVKGEKELSDFWIEDADFLKLKALTVRYNFDIPKIDILQSANVYVTGRDLFTLTKYSGMDPESSINGLDPGFEWHKNSYPSTRVWILGFQLSF